MSFFSKMIGSSVVKTVERKLDIMEVDPTQVGSPVATRLDPLNHLRQAPFFRSNPNPTLDHALVAIDLWHKCQNCQQMIYMREFEKSLRVCPKCQHHSRLRWFERISYLLDQGSFIELNPWLESEDPLNFQSGKEAYNSKMRESQWRTALGDALVTGIGTLEDLPLALAVADFSFMGASMGSVFGEKLVRLVETALEKRLPLVTISTSGGARMHEGLFSLMQMAKTTAAIARLGKAGLPHIALLTDPCYGGVTASYPMVADVILAEPGAMIGFAGPRVIEQTIRQALPEGFQTAEFLLEQGMLDRVVARRELREVLAGLLAFFRGDVRA
jgi:acetyl-CoA carboxylase carboxyl transferase subunit beta